MITSIIDIPSSPLGCETTGNATAGVGPERRNTKHSPLPPHPSRRRGQFGCTKRTYDMTTYKYIMVSIRMGNNVYDYEEQSQK